MLLSQHIYPDTKALMTEGDHEYGIQQNAPPFLELYGGEREPTYRRDGGGTRAEITRVTANPPWPVGFRGHTPAGVADAVDAAGRVPRFLPGPNHRDTPPRLGSSDCELDSIRLNKYTFACLIRNNLHVLCCDWH